MTSWFNSLMWAFDAARQMAPEAEKEATRQVMSVFFEWLRGIVRRDPNARDALEKVSKGKSTPVDRAFLARVVDAMARHNEELTAELTRLLEEMRAVAPKDVPGVTIRGDEPGFRGMPPRYLRNPFFFGRAREMKEIEAAVKPGEPTLVAQEQTQAQIFGKGGIGKTELVTEFVYRHVGDYPGHTWWLDCSSDSTLEMNLKRMAEHLGLGPELGTPRERVLEFLHGTMGWLLVLDDVRRGKQLADLLPRLGGTILITSQDTKLPYTANNVDVGLWSENEAVKFLTSRVRPLPFDPRGAADVAKRLGYLPLALEQAAAYVREHPQSPLEYLRSLSERPEELLKFGAPADNREYGKTVATTWDVAIKAIRKSEPAAVELLQLTTLMASDRIPERLFESHGDLLPPLLCMAVEQRRLADVAGVLHRYSLAHRDIAARELRVHRVVQEVVRTFMPPDERRARAVTMLRLMEAAMPRDADHPEDDAAFASFLPHAIAVTQLARAADADGARTLLLRVGTQIGLRAQRQVFRRSREDAMAILDGSYGAQGLDAAADFEALSDRLSELGHWPGAAACLERVLDIRRIVHGEGRVDDIPLLYKLVDALRQIGDREGKAERERQILRIQQRGGGVDGKR